MTLEQAKNRSVDDVDAAYRNGWISEPVVNAYLEWRNALPTSVCLFILHDGAIRRDYQGERRRDPQVQFCEMQRDDPRDLFDRL